LVKDHHPQAADGKYKLPANLSDGN